MSILGSLTGYIYIGVARTRGYLENILPPKGYLDQKSLGTPGLEHTSIQQCPHKYSNTNVRVRVVGHMCVFIVSTCDGVRGLGVFRHQLLCGAVGEWSMAAALLCSQCPPLSFSSSSCAQSHVNHQLMQGFPNFFGPGTPWG